MTPGPGLRGFRVGYGRARRAYLGILADVWEMSELDLLDWQRELNLPWREDAGQHRIAAPEDSS